MIKYYVKDNVPVNPKLPNCFHKMAIEDMPAEVIEKWMGQYYINTSDNKGCSVYCLTGGAWDRPSLQGIFDSIDDAIKWIHKKCKQYRKEA